MKASVRIANVYDNILEETTKKLVVEKDRKTYIGTLFFKKDKEEAVKKVHDRTEVDGTALDIVLAAYDLLKKHGMLAKDDKTLTTMMHWQYINGLTDEMLDGYGFENDTEYLKSIGK